MTVLSTMACTVSSAGIARPSFSDIIETLQAKFKSIYGSDAYIDPDSQDGQMLAAVAKAVDDCNATAVAVYNGFSPASAQGAALSSNVKINGIARAIATNGTATLTIGGDVGAVITGGQAKDANGNLWNLPPSVTIPAGGSIDVTGTAADQGTIVAAAGTITQIATPTRGWQTVNNATAAAPGAPIETDAALRQRQAKSTALPSSSILEGIAGAVAAVAGVTLVRPYENDTGITDANGIPLKSIALVVQGGADADIAAAVLRKKGPGCGTYGTTSVVANDSLGIPRTVKFFRPTPRAILVSIAGNALSGYTTAVGDSIKAALALWINSLGIGKKVDLGKLYLPAQLYGQPDSGKFEINSILISISPAAPAAADVAIAFNELATSQVSDITLTMT